jgi:hypothetical protein
MRLSQTEALEIIKAPKNSTFINAAREHEERLSLHTEPALSESSVSPALRGFFAWVESFLPADKFIRFKQLLTLPIETVDSTEAIFDELSKVFASPDGYTRVEFTSTSFEDDFNNYISDVRNYDNFWETRGLEALKHGICSFVVCDLPSEQTTLRPEPYFYLLPVKSVRDVLINERTLQVEYLAYWQKNGNIIFIDDDYYRIFERPEQGDWRLKEGGEIFHGLGYAPACSFYRDSIAGSKGINKRSPLTSSLTDLDWLLFWKVSQKYLNLYGAYPIVVSYKEKCDYRDKDGNECREKFINYTYQDNLGATCTAQKKCPACEARGLIGAGTHLTVEAPRDKNEADLMGNPVKFVEVSNDKLEWGAKHTEALEKSIFVKCVGFYQEPVKEAINEKQIASQFESRKTILDRIREQLEYVQTFALETTAKLRYAQYFKRAAVFMGKEYFLQTPTDLMQQLIKAKEAGMPSFELGRIRESYIKTKFKNNTNQYQRAMILSQLEPFADSSLKELKDMGIDEKYPKEFALKLDFTNFVAKFEREQMNIVDFGSLIPFKEKINIISQKLLSYVKEPERAKISSRTDGGKP